MNKTALITDLHAEEEFTAQSGVEVWQNWEKILADIKLRAIDEVIFLGDIGSQAAHQAFFDSLRQQEVSYKIVLGNHDNFAEVCQQYCPEYLDGKEGWYWSEESPSYQTIGLDTSTDTISKAQLDFLKAALQTDKEVFLFIHHPILETHTTPQRQFPLAGAEQIKAILQAHHRQIHIFCGHLHLDDIQTEGHITQTVTPSASIQIKRKSETAEIDHTNFAYRILSVEDNRLTSTVIWFDAENPEKN